MWEKIHQLTPPPPTQSLCTGELPNEWSQANVAPIFKKGSKLQAVNYLPSCISDMHYMQANWAHYL